MHSEISRRALVLGLTALGALTLFARPAAALTVAEARALIDAAVGEVNGVINSGKSERAMISDFERIFARYADVPTIALSCLGPAARSASDAQKRAYIQAFQGYITRKYGKRFREFQGGRIEVVDARPVRNFYEVISTAHLPGRAPFEVRWQVSDRSGRNLFFNLTMEGINMLSSERTEIGAMLDRRRGDVSAMTADLQSAG
jgi:phospholipid transport system substrate-binding protein